jgi:hypothetical protein
VTRGLARALLVPLALLIGSAGPAPKIIPHPEAQGEALIVPADSPVHFRRWDKYGYAQFDGSFVLTGTFEYGCGGNCADYEGPIEEADLQLRVVPDPSVAVSLPNWKIRHSDLLILVTNAKSLVRMFASPRQHAALRAGKIKDLRGRISIVVDHFRAGIECDAPSFDARFVRIVRPPKLASNIPDGGYGCV